MIYIGEGKSLDGGARLEHGEQGEVYAASFESNEHVRFYFQSAKGLKACDLLGSRRHRAVATGDRGGASQKVRRGRGGF